MLRHQFGPYFIFLIVLTSSKKKKRKLQTNFEQKKINFRSTVWGKKDYIGLLSMNTWSFLFYLSFHLSTYLVFICCLSFFFQMSSYLVFIYCLSFSIFKICWESDGSFRNVDKFIFIYCSKFTYCKETLLFYIV